MIPGRSILLLLPLLLSLARLAAAAEDAAGGAASPAAEAQQALFDCVDSAADDALPSAEAAYRKIGGEEPDLRASYALALVRTRNEPYCLATELLDGRPARQKREPPIMRGCGCGWRCNYERTRRRTTSSEA